MNLDNYENLDIYREANGWQFARAIDTRRSQPVAISLCVVDSTMPQGVVQEYLHCLQTLRDNPHPSLNSVLDVGVDDDQIVVVAEWLETEDLLARKDKGMSFDEIATMCVAIGAATQHLHSLGIVHRSIVQESVLFETSTQSFRLDVPIWHLSKQASTAEEDLALSAPEVLIAQRYSSASDIYSVGILLYSTLVGNFPWEDQTGVPRVRVEEDAVPRLPLAMSSIQKELDDMLAFDPNERKFAYKNILELRTARRTNTLVDRDIRFRSGLIDITEVEKVAQPLDRTVGSTSELSKGRPRFWLYSTLSAIVIVTVLVSSYAYTHLDGVRTLLYEIGLAEHPELGERWRQAESLRLDQNQSLITLIAAYNKVLELESGHSGAKEAISDEKQGRREKIESLIKSDEFALAQARLDDYVTAVPNDAKIAPLVTELENRQRRDRWLADTRPLVAAGIENLKSLDAAVSMYQTVLRLFPDSEEARRHLNDIAVLYVEEAIKAADESEIDRAWLFFEKAKEADPDVHELAKAQGIVELAESLETEINTTIQRATNFFDEGRLITPTGEDNAMSTYRQVLTLDPSNEHAQTKLNEIEQQLIAMHQGLLEEREFGAEAEFVRAARAAEVSEITLLSMADALTSLQQHIADAAQLLREARTLFQRGYISAPARDNAVEVLRKALAHDAKNTDVQALLDQCAERTAAVAQEAYRAGLVEPAKEYLSVAISIQPMNDRWLTQYRKWSQLD